MLPQTGDRAEEPWGATTMANHGACALLPPLHSLKPSDACTPALACQSQLGEGREPLT